MCFCLCAKSALSKLSMPRTLLDLENCHDYISGQALRNDCHMVALECMKFQSSIVAGVSLEIEYHIGIGISTTTWQHDSACVATRAYE